MERDKKDNSVGAFDCCFHPLALQHAENARPFRDLLVSTAIDAVEQSYKNQNQPTKLSRTYHVLAGREVQDGPPQAAGASRVESNFARLRSCVHARSKCSMAWRPTHGRIVAETLWRIGTLTHRSMSTQVSSDFNGKPPPANKKKNKKKKKKKPEGPSFADNIRGSLKSQPKPEPAKPLDDQRARARKLLEKANRKPSSNAAATPNYEIR